LIELALVLWLHGGAPAGAADLAPPSGVLAPPPPSRAEVAEILRLRALLQQLDLLQQMEAAEALPLLESQTHEVDDER